MALYIGSDKVSANSGAVLNVHTDATISADKVLEGEIGYGPNGKVIGSIPSKPATSYIPNSSVQTISAGQYLSGNQVISAVPTETKTVTPATSSQNITPSSGKYLSQVTVEGTGIINHYYTGSTDPDASLGSNGDLYLKV